MQMIASDRAMSRAFESRNSHRALFGAQQRRVLCATDLSTRSERALRAAAVLSARLNAQLMLLHVVPTRKERSARALAHGRLREQLSTSGVPAESTPVLAVRTGDTAEAIAAVALETRADLIVMGAQRKRALAPLTGTTAERVIASARCPVLIVRSNGTLRYDRVVVAADLSPSFEGVLHIADGWSFFDRVPVSIVHGFQSPYQGPLYAEGFDVAAARDYIARWKKVARAHLLAKVNAAGLDASRFDLRIEENRPLRVVRRALRSGTPSLLILGTSGHTFMSRMFRGSLANDALLSLDCDVLICGTDSPRGMLH
jgi:nucleotide-binding universal stress UspA family protein